MIATAEPDIEVVPSTAMLRIECPIALPVVNDLKAKYALLVIDGPQDKQGFVAVDAARKDVKRVRLLVENWRKDQNEEALKHQRTVNAAAKLIREPLELLEESLSAKQKSITDEVERLKREADEKQKREATARLKFRMDALAGLRYYDSPDIIAVMSEQSFAEFLELKTKSYLESLEAEKAAQARRDEEAARQRQESERLAEERKKLDADKSELERQKREQAERTAEAQRKIDEEANRLAREEARRLAKIESERLAAELKERGRLEAEERSKLDAEEAARRVVVRQFREPQYLSKVGQFGDYGPRVRRILECAADQIIDLTN